jgi:hypothetical protein
MVRSVLFELGWELEAGALLGSPRLAPSLPYFDLTLLRPHSGIWLQTSAVFYMASFHRETSATAERRNAMSRTDEPL